MHTSMSTVIGNKLVFNDDKEYNYSCHAAAYEAMMRQHNPFWGPLSRNTYFDQEDEILFQRMKKEIAQAKNLEDN